MTQRSPVNPASFAEGIGKLTRWVLVMACCLPAAAVAAGPAVAATSLFRDITKQSGIDFVHVNGTYGEKLLPEAMGGGVAFLDYDNDGDQDLFFVNSNYWPGEADPKDPIPTCALYRNRGDGTFEDVTKTMGLDLNLYGMGVAVGDYDGDGFDDIYITGLNRNRLLHNSNGKRFVDVTRHAGVAGRNGQWSTAAAFVDTDVDGDLDLVVLNYVHWSREINRERPFQIMGIGPAFGPPLMFSGTQPYLFENTGNGRFADISEKLAVVEPSDKREVMKGLGIAIIDLQDDGLPDLVVANDSTRNLLYRNKGGNEFEEQGISAGIAFDAVGGATNGMGIDAARIGDAETLAIAIGNFTWEMTSYFVKESGGGFIDESLLSGIGPATRNSLTFGLFFFDFDLDGFADLFHANGHMEPEVDSLQLEFTYAQPPQLFRGCFADHCASPYTPVAAGSDFDRPMVGRGAAYADIDGDGDLDIVITQTGGPPRLLRNEQQTGNNWLRLKLVDGVRPVLGSEVTISAGGRVQRQRLEVSKSYLSSVEKVLTFGLGRANEVDSLKILWPDGATSMVDVAELNTLQVIDRTSLAGNESESGEVSLPAATDAAVQPHR
jgi:hypothetical protein